MMDKSIILDDAYLSDPESNLACKFFLDRIYYGETIFCLNDLMQLLIDIFEPAYCALLWVNRRNFRICSEYIALGKEKPIYQDEYAELIYTKLILKDRFITPKDFDDEKEIDFPFKKICFIRVPRLYISQISTGFCVICMADSNLYPPLSLTEKISQLLVEIINTWAWRVSHFRRQLDNTCNRYITSYALNMKEFDEKQEYKKSIDDAANYLRKMLSIRDLVNISNAYFSNEDNRTQEIVKSLSEYLGNDLKKWRHCAPPLGWPPDNCSQCEKQSIFPYQEAKSLIYWSLWRYKDPVTIGAIRRWKEESIVEEDDYEIQIFIDEEISDLIELDFEDDQYNKDRRLKFAKSQYILRNISIKYLSNTSAQYSEWGLKKENSLQFKPFLNYFFCNALDSINLRDSYWNSDAPSDEDVSELLYQIAITSHYLMADQPLDENVIQCTIAFLSEYAHRYLEVPDRIDFRLHLLQAARHEPPLHAMKAFYRDHFFHAMEVCFLGHFLLDLQVAENRYLWETVADSLECHGDKKRVLRLWYIAALLHDIGYAMDVLNSVKKVLNFFQASSHVKELNKELEQALDNLSKKIGDERFVDYVKEDKPGEDHGIVGAKHLESLLDQITKNDPAIHTSDFEDSIHAIALHNSRKHKVYFSREPLAFLLILCDTIQEWNRPRMGFSIAPLRILSALSNSLTPRFSDEGIMRSIRMNVKRNDDNHFLIDSRYFNGLRIQLEFNEKILNNAGVFTLWLDSFANIQRLDCTGFDLDIEIEYKTPPYKAALGPTWQLYRLRDAARETHMEYIKEWFPKEKKTGILDIFTFMYSSGPYTWIRRNPCSHIGTDNNAISHYFNPDENEDGMEHLIYNIKEVTKKKRITKDISEFRKDLQRWQDYNEDREFSGDYGGPEYPS